ncbi:hypothetical protein ABZS52_30675 [Micromonospora profundi]|uniref:hypothetical protein n=1 Tax=Micromonospora profundi TaxID=1420889 RepID=UPI0033BD26E9
MNGWELVVGVILGLIVNEMTDLSPWAARRLVFWAAYRWTPDTDIAEGYAEEWTAIIDERPGKLLKLLTAVQFSLGAARRAAPRTLASVRTAVVRWVAEWTGQPEVLARDFVTYGSVSLAVTLALGYASGYIARSLNGTLEWIITLIIISGGFIAGLACALDLHRKYRALSGRAVHEERHRLTVREE